MSETITRELKNATAQFPGTWVEINPENACIASNIVICTDEKHVGVFYNSRECAELTREEEIEIVQCAVMNGFEKNQIHLYGLISEEYLNNCCKNVGNAIIRRRR